MIYPVTDEVSHGRALGRIEALWSAAPGSAEEQELDALATLVDAYERRAFPIAALDPIVAIETRCEQLGWTRRELEPLIGSRARVSEVLTGRRALTLPMIRRLHAALGIPAEILISQRVRAARSARGVVKARRGVDSPTAQQAVGADGGGKSRSRRGRRGSSRAPT